jgi:hypothetical protein
MSLDSCGSAQRHMHPLPAGACGNTKSPELVTEGFSLVPQTLTSPILIVQGYLRRQMVAYPGLSQLSAAAIGKLQPRNVWMPKMTSAKTC